MLIIRNEIVYRFILCSKKNYKKKQKSTVFSYLVKYSTKVTSTMNTYFL